MTPEDVRRGERTYERLLAMGIATTEWSQQSDHLAIWLREHVEDLFAALRRDLGMAARAAPWPPQRPTSPLVRSTPVEAAVERAARRTSAEQRILDQLPRPGKGPG